MFHAILQKLVHNLQPELTFILMRAFENTAKFNQFQVKLNSYKIITPKKNPSQASETSCVCAYSESSRHDQYVTLGKKLDML